MLATVASIFRCTAVINARGVSNLAQFGIRPVRCSERRPCAETWVGWGEILGMGVRPRWNR